MIEAESFRKALDLECLVPSSKTEWDIRTPDLNRPGMQFCGFYDFFAYERPQVVGRIEMAFLEQLESEKRYDILEPFFSYEIPCVIICRGQPAPKELIDVAKKHGIAIYRTDLLTTRFSTLAIKYLNRALAPHVNKHGVLLDVYGNGVLLTGKSGVGKSEAALELIKRGHQLVADDIVDICRIAENRLIGTCPEPIRHFMEIRGIGIIDVRAMYGISAVCTTRSIDLVIELEDWNEDKNYDRLGLTEDYIEILGVQIPYHIMPVRPGRNLAIIVEVASRNHSLKRLGYNAAKEMNQRVMRQASGNSSEIEDNEND